MPTIHLSGGGRGPGNGVFVYLPGATLIVIGVLILALPDLLRWLVAAFFLAIGAVLLAAGAQIRQGGLASRWLGSLQDRFRGP